MKWVTVEELSRSVPLPPGYRFEIPRHADIAQVIEAVRNWFPNVEVGAASCFLRPEFYARRVHLADSQDAGATPDVLVILAFHGDELAAVYAGQIDVDARIATARLAVIAPRHRGVQLGTAAPRLIEAGGRAMSMDLACFMATLAMPQIQAAAEHLGWQLAGIIPGSDLEMVRPGEVRRVSEALYVKLLCSPDKLHPVEPGNLTAATRELYRRIFGGV